MEALSAIFVVVVTKAYLTFFRSAQCLVRVLVARLDGVFNVSFTLHSGSSIWALFDGAHRKE